MQKICKRLCNDGALWLILNQQLHIFTAAKCKTDDFILFSFLNCVNLKVDRRWLTESSDSFFPFFLLFFFKVIKHLKINYCPPDLLDFCFVLCINI